MSRILKLAQLPPDARRVATDIIFAMDLPGNTDFDLELVRRHPWALRRRMVAAEFARRALLEGDL